MRFRVLAILLASLIFIIAGFFFSLPLINSGRIIYGTWVAGLKIGGLKFSEAEKILGQKIDKFSNSEIIFYQTGQKIAATPLQLGIKISSSDNLSLLKNVGRPPNFWQGTWRQLFTFFGQQKTPLVYLWDKSTFRKFWAANEEVFISDLPQSATLGYDFEAQEFKFVPGQSGQKINQAALAEKITENIISLKIEPINIAIYTSQPFIFEEQQTAQAKSKAEAILSLLPYRLLAEDFSQPINKYQLIDWLKFEPRHEKNSWVLGIAFEQQKIKKYLQDLSSALYQTPVNARLTLSEEKITIFSLPKEGRSLNIEKSVQTIQDKVLEGSQEITLVFDKIPPDIKTNENIIKLGLTSFLEQGESNFAGSPQNRIHNIQIGATKLSGILIKPGEKFSFLENLGEVGPEQGYLSELVIKKDKTIPEYGGGLCQVSTTVFRAAVNSGLKITERAPHAFPVKYYSPQGFDATIYPPHPDLIFVNDTPSNILIQSKIIGTRLVFEIYGTKDDRQVKVKGPYVLESNPDGSMKTVLYQEIWRGGELARKDIFRSNYKSPDLYPVERNPLE